VDVKRYALWVQYDGTLFQGFQRLTSRHSSTPLLSGNPRRWPRHKTVQEELEVKLSLLLRENVVVWGSGRTDTGVHATQQVVAFDTHCQDSIQDLRRRLNAVLCSGLSVTHWQQVAATFHPRFSARQRTYHYYLWPDAPASNPFWDNRCWLLPHRLDLQAMRQAALPLLGSHDFSAYTRKPENDESRTRNLQRLEIHDRALGPSLQAGPWAQADPLVCLEISANAFLRRMVRLLVANLVKVGCGEWPPGRPYEILQSRDPMQSARPAPAHGLYLVQIQYP
jgi:tRNA pseudouridine38-40 synthase